MPPLLWALTQALRGPGRESAPARGCGRCGCSRDLHEHYRPGTDCGRCSAATCPRFVGRSGTVLRLARAAARLLAS